jgi:hypothetical protein
MDTPLNQETVNDTAKLIMHRLIARSLARDPMLVDRAKVSLAKISLHFPDRSFVTDWDELLRRPTRELRTLLTSRDQNMKRLRLSSPFVTAEGVDFSDQALRRRIWRAAKRIVARASRRALDSAKASGLWLSDVDISLCHSGRPASVISAERSS